MTDTIVNIAKVAFVAGLYIFLYWVARAIRGHVASERTRRPEAPEHVPLLVVTRPEESKRTIEVRRPIVVGRGTQVDVTLEDAFASDRHARFDTTAGNLFVHDLGSTNGTMVNGRRVTERTALAKGDAVQIGGTIMEVR
ncbi:MAG TPA: FHA domain-containing protein [Acidimicrobiia bacterium]|nr:FHA domain-containing protein [Acidimicrobiia bacterium]